MKFMGSIVKTFILSLLIIGQVHFAYAQTATASILPPAKTTFFDANGNPLALGTVEFFIPTTTTHKTTWQDAAETIPNQNPLTLDSAGRALILGSGSYRQVIKDRNNNLVWDQVTASTGSGGVTPSLVGDGAAVGTIQLYTGAVVPANYMLAYGAQVSRTTFSILLNAITSSASIFCTAGSPILSGFADTTSFPIGANVEVSCTTSGQSTIISKTSTTITLAANANVTVNTTAVIFPWGNGNGSSTFTLPDYRGIVPVGNNNMGGVASLLLNTNFYTGGNPNSIGSLGGSQFQILQTVNLPPYAPAGTNSTSAVATTSTPTNVLAGSIANGAQNFTTGGGSLFTALSQLAVSGAAIPSTGTAAAQTFTGTAQGGTSTAFSVVQPSKTLNFIVKVLPDNNISIASCLQLADAGTACQANTGTTGHVLGFLDANNVHTGQETFNNINVAGGAITGMPNPVNPSDVAIKSYVDGVATGLHILAPSTLATATVLPNTPTYANGTLGVGATLTAGSNSTLTVDGVTAALNAVVLVKNQASNFQNGIYSVTAAGSGSVPWILTRVTYFDQAAEMLSGSYTLVTGGTSNLNSSWVLQTTVATVGTSPANFVLFSTSSITPPGGSNLQVQYNNGGLFGGLTDVQLTTRCQPFTSTLSGCVTASGGSTTSFLNGAGAFIPTAYSSFTHLAASNQFWIPPSPNNYQLFQANGFHFNQNSLFTTHAGTQSAFVPTTGSHLIVLDAQIWVSSGVGNPSPGFNWVIKWIKNATVDANGFQTPSTGSDVCTGIGSPSVFAPTVILNAHCVDVISPGDYYNLFMLIDPATPGGTVGVDGNPAHTFVQATVLN